MKRKIKLILAIRSLEIGGAERQFLEIAKKISSEDFELQIVTLYPGTLDNEVNPSHLFCFNKNSRLDFGFFIKLLRFFYKNKPDIVYSFMPDMNVYMAICKILVFKKFKLVWGQFGSEPDFSKYPPIRKLVTVSQRWLLFVVNAILFDGTKGVSFYDKYKIKHKRTKVISSGTDINRFIRNKKNRNRFRDKFNLTEKDIAIGICSRLDPMKGYLVLANAAKIILAKHPSVTFFSIGYGDNRIITEVDEILGNYSHRFIFLGKLLSPEDTMSGWDIYCSPSLFGEGFSNSIIEAMSCSLPVIASDVGDAPYQIDGVGTIVSPNDVEGLYVALDGWIYSNAYRDLGKKARKKVVDQFSSSSMVKITEDYLINILHNQD